MPTESELLLQQAVAARRNHRPDEARRNATEAVRVCRQSGPALELAEALKLLGEIERNLHEPAAALQAYEEAVAIYRVHGHPLRLAHTVRHLGDIHRHEGSLEPARKCYVEALDLYRSHPESAPLDLANAIRGYALQREAAGESAEARSLWQEAKQLYSDVNVEAGVAESTERLAALA